MTEQVGKHRVAAKKTIQSAFQELHKAPDEREKALLAQCGETVTSKFTNLQIQMEEMASLRAEITSCCAAISETQKSHTDTVAVCCHGTADTTGRVKEEVHCSESSAARR